MTFTITGIGLGKRKLFYEKETLEEAGCLASRMADNGVTDAHIFDGAGNEIGLDDAFQAYLRRPQL